MNLLLTTYLTGGKDPQRDSSWRIDDFSIIQNLFNSVKYHDLHMHILHYELSESFTQQYTNDRIKFVKCTTQVGLNLCDDRWKLYHDHLLTLHEIEKVFMVDVSDVIVLSNPFIQMDSNKVYCGDETTTICKNKWIMQKYSKLKHVNKNSYIDKTVLNAGILGATYCNAIDITRAIYDFLCVHVPKCMINAELFDMLAMNHILRTGKWKDKLVHGRPVNTIFKAYETNTSDAWFKHK